MHGRQSPTAGYGPPRRHTPCAWQHRAQGRALREYEGKGPRSDRPPPSVSCSSVARRCSGAVLIGRRRGLRRVRRARLAQLVGALVEYMAETSWTTKWASHSGRRTTVATRHRKRPRRPRRAWREASTAGLRRVTALRHRTELASPLGFVRTVTSAAAAWTTPRLRRSGRRPHNRRCRSHATALRCPCQVG